MKQWQVGLVVSFLSGSMLMVPVGSALAAPPNAPGSAELSADVRAESEARQRDELLRQAEIAASARALDKLIGRCQSIADRLAAQSAHAAKLSQRLAELPTSDEGKRLASTLNEASARDLQGFLDAPPVDGSRLAVDLEQAGKLLAALKVQRQEAAPGYVPPATLLEELDELERGLQHRKGMLEERSARLDLQLAGAPAKMDTSQKPTLADVLKQFRHQEFLRQQEQREKGMKAAREKEGDTIGKVAEQIEAERIRDEAQRVQEAGRAANARKQDEFRARQEDQRVKHEADMAEQRRKQALAEAERQKKEAQTSVIAVTGKTEAEKVLLRQRCQDARVQQLLAPFLRPGTWQGIGNKASIDPAGFSYSALRKSGALEETHKGLDKLLDLATSKRDGTRPRWSYNPNVSRLQKTNPRGLAEVREAQRLLIELGDTMVQLGMLSE